MVEHTHHKLWSSFFHCSLCVLLNEQETQNVSAVPGQQNEMFLSAVNLSTVGRVSLDFRLFPAVFIPILETSAHGSLVHFFKAAAPAGRTPDPLLFRVSEVELGAF